MFNQIIHSFPQSRYLHLHYLLFFPLILSLFFQLSCKKVFPTNDNQSYDNIVPDPHCYDLEIETTLAYEVQQPVRLLNGVIWVDGHQVTEYCQNENTHMFHIPFERMYEIEFERPQGLPLSDAGTGLIPLRMQIKAKPLDETTGDTIRIILPCSRAIMVKGDETQYVQRQLQNSRHQFQIKKITFKGMYLKKTPETSPTN